MSKSKAPTPAKGNGATGTADQTREAAAICQEHAERLINSVIGETLAEEALRRHEEGTLFASGPHSLRTQAIQQEYVALLAYQRAFERASDSDSGAARKSLCGRKDLFDETIRESIALDMAVTHVDLSPLGIRDSYRLGRVDATYQRKGLPGGGKRACGDAIVHRLAQLLHEPQSILGDGAKIDAASFAGIAFDLVAPLVHWARNSDARLFAANAEHRGLPGYVPASEPELASTLEELFEDWCERELSSSQRDHDGRLHASAVQIEKLANETLRAMGVLNVAEAFRVQGNRRHPGSTEISPLVTLSQVTRVKETA